MDVPQRLSYGHQGNVKRSGAGEQTPFPLLGLTGR